ncbi:hypothetical protein DSO57_1023084 [Entomophthora muscae]|uniref:Uncharacterized protein n=1 Tax=Entomophthora muscae TaxID=34485 RepID=A0ACC2TQF7_9FUNG|nr:hypothetical protein DSO57_1023084 [Entomophthora muscae]
MPPTAEINKALLASLFTICCSPQQIREVMLISWACLYACCYVEKGLCAPGHLLSVRGVLLIVSPESLEMSQQLTPPCVEHFVGKGVKVWLHSFHDYCSHWQPHD